MTCRKETKFKCDCSIEDIYRHCEGTNKINIFRVVFVDRANKMITLIHRADFTSNGEKLFLRLDELEDGSVEVTAISQSLTPLRLFDWGRNTANLNILTSYFTEFARAIHHGK